MQFSKCRLKLDVVSAFSLVQDYNTFIYERLLSTPVTSFARVALSLSLKRTLVGRRRFRPNVAAVSGRRFRHNSGHLEFMSFWVQQPSELSVEERNLLSSANKFPSCWCCSISVHGPHVLFVVVDFSQFTLQGSRAQIWKSLEISRRQADSRLVTMSQFCDSFQCSRMLRRVEHLFLLVSSIFFALLREGILTLTLVQIEFRVKTLHLGTVSVSLKWSSPLPRYRCCVDCLYCDLDP